MYYRYYLSAFLSGRANCIGGVISIEERKSFQRENNVGKLCAEPPVK